MLEIKRKALYNPLYICIGFLLMILSIIWNFETGVVYSMSVIAFFIVLVMKKYKLNQKRLYYMIAVLLVAFILVILAALGLTGLINVSMGGNMITFKKFIFPLMNESYFDYLKEVQIQVGKMYICVVLE